MSSRSTPGHGSAELLAKLALELEARHDDTTGVLTRVVHVAAAEVPGADLAGVTIIGSRGAQTPAYSDELVVTVDRLQYSTGQGPCLEAATTREPMVRSDDLATEPRWPAFASRAAALGVASMLSVPMFVVDGRIGALNMYARSPGAFPPDAADVAAPLAMHAAVAFVGARRVADLRVAIDSRDVIGQAKGILMERFKIDANAAFELLIVASQRTNRKLRVVAEELAATGQLPD